MDKDKIDEKIEAHEARMQQLREQEEEQKRQATERLRQDYLKRTGRTEMKP